MARRRTSPVSPGDLVAKGGDEWAGLPLGAPAGDDRPRAAAPWAIAGCGARPGPAVGFADSPVLGTANQRYDPGITPGLSAAAAWDFLAGAVGLVRLAEARGRADAGTVRNARAALDHVGRLHDSSVQVAARKAAIEQARGLMDTIEPTDAAMLRALRTGLELIARNVGARADAFAAHDFEVGRELARWSVVVLEGMVAYASRPAA